MPREYRQATPGGDPTNPLSLVSVVDLPQVSFTPQIGVAEPENQFEQLQRILVGGAQAAKATFDYQANKAENTMAINAAVERAQARVDKQRELIAEAKQKESAQREVLAKKEQDQIINWFQGNITSAMVEERWADAATLADKFAATYPANENPYAYEKAEAERLRVKSAYEVWSSKRQTELDKLSRAKMAEGFGVVMDRVNALDGLMKEPTGEGKRRVMSLFDGTGEMRFPNGVPMPYVPDSQLHNTLISYLFDTIPQPIRDQLTSEDMVQLTKDISIHSERIRSQVIDERTRQNTFRQMEMRTQAATYLAQTIKDPADLPKLFEEFELLEQDKQNRVITQTQQGNLERNLVANMAQGLGSESPVSGALAWATLIDAAETEGKIPTQRANQIAGLLRKRATAEAKSRINDIMLKAREANVNESTYFYEEYPFNNPSIELGLQLGVYTKDPNTQEIKTVVGAEKVDEALKEMGAEWIRQEARFQRRSAVSVNLESIDSLIVTDNSLDLVRRNFREDKIEFVKKGVETILTPEAKGVIANANSPKDLEPHLVSLKRGADGLIAEYETGADLSKYSTLTVKGGAKVRVPSEVIGNETFRQAYEMVNAGDPRRALQFLILQSADPKFMENNDNRIAMMYGFSMVTDQNMTIAQRNLARSINPKSSNLFTRAELSQVATTSASDLLKGSAKMSPFQKEIAEDKTARLIKASGYQPSDWFEYVNKNYFTPGQGLQAVLNGYDLLVSAKGESVDSFGNVIKVAPFGNAEAEVRMREKYPVMYHAVVAAEAQAFTARAQGATGAETDPRYYLRETFELATALEARAKESKTEEAMSRMIPSEITNPQTGLPYRDNQTQRWNRFELLRRTFADVFKTEIPKTNEYGAEKDPYVNLSLDDELRMEASFRTYKDKGFADELALKMTLRDMGHAGFKPIVPGTLGDWAPEDSNAKVMFVFDPYNIVPDPEMVASPEYKEYMTDFISFIKGQQVKLGKQGGMVVTFNYNNDYSEPDSSLTATVTDPNGNNRIDIRSGITRQNFILWRDNRMDWRDRMTVVTGG